MFPVMIGQGETTVRLVRKSTLKGKVLHPDGTPAAGVFVEAAGVGKDSSDEYDRGYAKTATDGSYAVAVAPDHSYMIGIHDASWAARSLTGIVLRQEGRDPGSAPSHTDQRDAHPGAAHQRAGTRGLLRDQWVSLQEDGEPLPNDYKVFTMEGREWLTRGAKTDRDGKCSFRVGPGEYRLGPSRGEPESIKVESRGDDSLRAAVERERRRDATFHQRPGA